ncbi:MAG: M20/M25/M40 family metallo-hydrolase [Flavonifractor plautii]
MLREWLAWEASRWRRTSTACPPPSGQLRPGRPVLGFLCEYDALPEVGHGCGHDLIGVVSAGAAAALRQTVDAVGGTLIVYGTPDEEITCTKVQLTDEGAFDELDVALMLHPYQKTCGRMGSIGIYPVQYEFFGKKCHANEAGPGSDCINALDAAVAAYLSVNQVKQYLDANIYGILNSGGTLPNIIPDYASLRYNIRCDQMEDPSGGGAHQPLCPGGGGQYGRS